ncbi:MAG: DUF202 domain-containing protein [Dehalococcoidia bacterium]
MADSAAQEQAKDALIRTHLANERTFLAWLRTAVVIIGAGMAAAVLTETEGDERTVALAIAVLSVIAGGLMVAFGYLNYRHALGGITRGTYSPGGRLPLLATGLTVLVALGGLLFVILEWSVDS